MVAFTVLPTVAVEMLKIAVVAPARTVTLLWTVALPLPEVRVIPTPPTAAGLDRVTVPVTLVPPFTVLDESVRFVKIGGLIVRTAVWVELPRTAEIVAVFALCTATVFTVNVPVVEPPATVATTVAYAVLLDDMVTVVPPLGAGPLSVTVPVDVVAPYRDAGERATLTSVAGLIVRVPD